MVSGLGALCTVAQYNGDEVFLIYGEPLRPFPDGTDLLQKYVYLPSVTFMLNAEAILLALVHGYLKFEPADGAPLTEKGAERLSIRFIYSGYSLRCIGGCCRGRARSLPRRSAASEA